MRSARFEIIYSSRIIGKVFILNNIDLSPAKEEEAKHIHEHTIRTHDFNLELIDAKMDNLAKRLLKKPWMSLPF